MSLTTYPDLGFYSPEDPWLKELLLDKMSPDSLFQKPGYSKKDMMDYLMSLHKSGVTSYFGSPKAGMVLRNYFPNQYVVEPHIVGNPLAARTIIKVGIDFAFKSTSVRKINVYTHLKPIKTLALKLGFTHEGTLSDTYYVEGHLHDVFVLGLKKADYEI